MEKKLVMQLKRVRGQIGGIEKMIEGNRECEEVLMQLGAATNSLKSVAREILASEAVRCHKSEKDTKSYAMLLKRFF